jgi:uncharacterized protein (TIGR03437 family)
MKTSSEHRTLVSRSSRWFGTTGATLRLGLAAVALASAAWGGTFGKVVPIGGQASDIALDETRGVLYIANFAANRIEIMNTSDLTISQSINVNPLPGSIALSRDGQFLLVAHYGNFKPPASLDAALTLINLRTNTRQVFSLPAAPLAVAFGADGLALVVTTADVSLLDPVAGVIQTIDTHASLASKTLPVPVTSPAPVQITESALGVSGDGWRIYGTTTAFGIVYDVASQSLSTFPTAGAQPPFGPRSVSVNQDGSLFAFAWVLFNGYGGLEAEFQNPTGLFNVGGYALDSGAGLLYMQVPDVVTPDAPPTLQVRDVDSLAVRDTFLLPENLAGKSLVSSGHVIYSISDSGVLVMQAGAMGQQPRLKVSAEDVVFSGAFCDRRTSTQTLTISDPGGNATDFTLTANGPGITITPSSGVTPATVRVSIDPNVFANQNGTFSASIQVSSQAAVNLLQPVRVLINTRDPDQRGTVMNIPGKLVDLLADPVRDRFYIVRQDQDVVLVFDGSSYNQIATLPTKLAPTQLAMTRDGKYLMIAHEDSATVSVYDLDTLQRQAPIYFPYGHIPRSIAAAGGGILAAVHNRVVGGLNSAIDRVDFDNRLATQLPTLGALENKINSYTVLAATPNGASIFGVVADGSVFLYDSNSDTFPVFRKDLTVLSGAYAASNLNQYVVGNNFMNASLVTARKFDTMGGVPSGFAFAGQVGLMATTPGPSSPGMFERVDLSQGGGVKPTRIVESTIVPFPIVVPPTPVPGAPPLPPAPDPNISPFTRSVAPLSNGNAIILLTQSGFTVLPSNFDAANAIPQITAVVNTGDRSQPLTAGGLISVLGSNLSSATVSSNSSPLPTILGDSCVTVNGSVIPLFLVSPPQINAQLPVTVGTSGVLIVYTPGGISNPFTLGSIQPTAPTVLQVPSGPGSTILVPAVFREQSSLPVNLVDPIHKGDHLIIYASGLGPTDPVVAAGSVSPSPAAVVLLKPVVTLGGVTCPVTFAGLTPGQIGVYQIDVNVPQGVTQGLNVPLTVCQGTSCGTVNVRVVQ